MNDNPYQTSLGQKLGDSIIRSLSRVLSTEHSLSKYVGATGSDLTTGTDSYVVTLRLLKQIKIEYVQSHTQLEVLEWEAPKGINKEILDYIRDGIRGVISLASIEPSIMLTRFDTNKETVYLEVAIPDLDLVTREFLPRTIVIAYA